MIWIHFTEHMSLNVDGRGNSVYNIAKSLSEEFSKDIHIIIAGKWHKSEKRVEKFRDNLIVLKNETLYKLYKSPIPKKLKSILIMLFISLFLFITFLKLRKTWKMENMIIFGHHLWGGLTAFMIATICSKYKIFLVLYGTAGAYGKIWDTIESIVLKLISPKFKRIFVLDDGSNIIFKVKKLCDRTPITIFPQAVADTFLRFKAKQNNKLKYSKNKKFKMLTLSPFNPAKNLEQVLYAMYYLKKMNKKLYNTSELILVGDGPLKEHLKKLAIQLGISENVNFTKRISHEKVIEYLDSSDLLLATSKHNSNFGRVVIEALSRKLPVLVTNTGRTSEFLTHLKTAVIVDNDPEKMLKL